MQLSDITVEVRDKALNRIGQIRHEELLLTAGDEFNNVGHWTLKLAAEHPLTEALRTPGSGIIVNGPNDVLLSGPTTTPKTHASKADPAGSVSFEGVTDTIVLADMLAFPDPTNVDPTTQTVSHDVREGNVETLLHEFVNANMGPSAPPARRKANFVMGANFARGGVTKKRARFQVLGNLLAELAVVADLGFRVVQRGTQLVFETYLVQDRTATIRLDVLNGTLTSQEVAIAPPGATQVIVAGQGDLVDRQFYAATTAEALAAEVEWGRRIERFVDQRQTEDTSEHVQKANEVLFEEGFTQVSMRVTPMDDTTMRFGHDWGLGDRVSVVLSTGEAVATVSGFVLLADEHGLRLGTTVGNPSGLDRDAAATRRLESTSQRVANLERSESGDDGYVMSMMGVW